MMSDDYTHKSVLLDEAIEALAIHPDGIYIDATFGRGGHTQAILKRLSAQGRLIAIDKDEQAVRFAQQNYGDDQRFTIVHAGFNQLKEIVERYQTVGRVNGVLLDLGISSPQVDDPVRGFSFLQDGPLDMRMDTTKGVTAAEWINNAKETAIADVLYTLGEERFSRRIARAIVEERAQEPITTTGRLAAIVKQANPKWEKHKHPATRSFQAIRIFVNHELEELESCLDQAVGILAVSGRLAVISFHSLEDRIVKRFIRKQSSGEDVPAGLPIVPVTMQPKLKRLGRAIKPTAAEIEGNPRSRSAVLRVAEKLL